ncbi:MAG: hypothetical protein R3B84_15580 [Zavarzinella sp.]
MKFPDDSPAKKVKCPACGNIFLSTEGVSARSSSRDDDDEPRPRRGGRYDEDEDEDDRPRKRKSSRYDDDEDDDDRPRKRKASRYDDDADDDDRPRKRKSSRYDDDEDDDDGGYSRRSSKKPSKKELQKQFAFVPLSLLLMTIAGWIWVGGAVLLAISAIITWAGANYDEGPKLLSILAGASGLGALLTAATAFGFQIAGPRARGALGLAIALAATMLLHIILSFVAAADRNNAFGPAFGSFNWGTFATTLTAIGNVLFISIAIASPDAGDVFLGILLNLTGIAIGVLYLLYLRSLAMVSGDRNLKTVNMKVCIGFSIACGAIWLLGILFALLLEAIGKESGLDLLYAMWILNYLVIGSIWALVTMVIMKNKAEYSFRY